MVSDRRSFRSDGGETHGRSVSESERICHGCHDPPPKEVELRTFKMEYGGYETLCPDCVRESHDIIDHRVPQDEAEGGES